MKGLEWLQEPGTPLEVQHGCANAVGGRSFCGRSLPGLRGRPELVFAPPFTIVLGQCVRRKR